MTTCRHLHDEITAGKLIKLIFNNAYKALLREPVPQIGENFSQISENLLHLQLRVRTELQEKKILSLSGQKMVEVKVV